MKRNTIKKKSYNINKPLNYMNLKKVHIIKNVNYTYEIEKKLPL